MAQVTVVPYASAESWNVQRVTCGLSALISHLSELEDWDADGLCPDCRRSVRCVRDRSILCTRIRSVLG